MAFLSIPLFTRLLAPADYGRYALVLATVNVLNALLFQWLRLSLVRYLPAYKDDVARLKSTLTAAMCLLILATGLIAGVACVLPFTRAWRPVILPCWILLSVQAFYELCCEYARAVIRPWRYMGLQLARSSSTVILGAVLILAGAGWHGPLLAVAIGMVLAIAGVWKSDWSDVRLLLDRPTLSRLCQYGIPLSLTVALAVVIGSCDRFLIAWFKGEDAAGLYSVAVDFTSQTLSLLMMVVYLAMFPVAVRAFEHEGREAAQKQMGLNMTLLLAIGVPCVVGLTILAPGISNCFLGKNYRTAAASIMPLVALGTFLAGLKAYHFDSAFQFAHKTIYQVWIVLFAAALNVVLNVVAIPRYGINGSAVASVIAYVASIGLTAYLGRRHFVLPFPKSPAIRILAAGGAMALLILPLRNHVAPAAVAAQIAGAALVYGAVLVALDFMGLRGILLRKLAEKRATSRSTNKHSVVLQGSVADGMAGVSFETDPVGMW
jgi:O-antigen/teichoic acid export membrane protein